MLTESLKDVIEEVVCYLKKRETKAMMLISKQNNWEEFYCDITTELDRLAGIKPIGDFCSWRHYILVDKISLKDKCLSIRIPGGTVGTLFIDDSFIITKIIINPRYVVKTYPIDINEKIEKFVNTKIDGILAEEIV